jgi:hypothetical protein
MKLRESPVCEACTYNATEFLQHFLLECRAYKNIRDQSVEEKVDSVNVFMSCLDFTELWPLQKVQFLIGDICYYLRQECGNFFDRIGKTMPKSMHVFRSSVLNIDWNIFLVYYLSLYLFLFFIL